ncbi:MAG: M50 family metallopeptidase, partial [Dehalococcoidia bacterium]|nr:M50 family metallopeptidase [Dehalococcoidia bacterium]
MNFTLISALYLLAALYTVVMLARGWRGLLAPRPTPADRNLASLVAFLLLTPPAVYLHELGHAAAVVALGGQVREIGFFLYWGYTAYTGRFSPPEVWMIAAAGPLVTLILGGIGIGVGLAARLRPALNLLAIQFGVLQMLQILLFYPLLTAANLGDLPGSDFAALYDPATPSLAVVAGVIHAGAAAILLIGARLPAVRRRYAVVTGHEVATFDYTPPKLDPSAPSIYHHLTRHLDPAQPGLAPGGDPLPTPSAERVMAPNGRHWLPGGDVPPAPTVETILAALRALATAPSPRTRQQAQAVLAADPAADHLTATLRALVATFDADSASG